MELLLSLLLFAAAATLTPGGATSLATASGMHRGVGKSLPLIFGLASGLAVMAGLAVFGLGKILLLHPGARLGLAAVGTAYFVWLAWRIARSGQPDLANVAKAPPRRFHEGVLLLSLNPKAWTMTLSAAASFGALAPDAATLAALMAVGFGTFSLLSLLLWCAGGVWIAATLRRPLHWTLMNGVLAILLIASIVPVWAHLFA